jgi:CheY-like chemotaxis protein
MEDKLMRRVLIVEDDHVLRTVVCGVLRNAGFTIEEAGDGIEALNQLQHGHSPFDLVISDVEMPRLSGLELTHTLRSAGCSIPVVLTSGGNLPEGYCLDAHTRFLRKPYRLIRLHSEISALLDHCP